MQLLASTVSDLPGQAWSSAAAQRYSPSAYTATYMRGEVGLTCLGLSFLNVWW